MDPHCFVEKADQYITNENTSKSTREPEESNLLYETHDTHLNVVAVGEQAWDFKDFAKSFCSVCYHVFHNGKPLCAGQNRCDEKSRRICVNAWYLSTFFVTLLVG